MFESLETRRLFAVTVVQNGSVLTINGDAKDNHITVVEGTGVKANNTPRTAGQVLVETSTLPNGVITSTEYSGITRIVINGNEGSDVIDFTGTTVGADIHGDNASANSNTTSAVSTAGKKGNKGGSNKNGNKGGSKNGGDNGNGQPGTGDGAADGNDSISVNDSGTGSSIVNGDGGNDTITLLRGNNTAIFGGAGADTIFVDTTGDPSSSSNVDAGAGNDSVVVYGGTNTLNGGDGNDSLGNLGGTNTISGFESISP
jgi:Ca2+-binding RTX toxin-like protein